MALVLVRGIGDVGSAVAHRLFTAGHTAVMHDVERPAHARRGMAFTDVMFDGYAYLAGVLGKRARNGEGLQAMVRCRRAVVITADERDALDLRPAVLVDARMRKHLIPETVIGLAPVTIGLGPNFEAGRNVDIAIETSWGDRLGAVIAKGATLPLLGEPRAIAGHQRDRFLYASVEGEFSTDLSIGDAVVQGAPVGRIGAHTLLAPLTGRLRGLTHTGAWVTKGTKVVEVDPRGPDAVVTGLGERPARIADGVSRAIEGSAPLSSTRARGSGLT